MGSVSAIRRAAAGAQPPALSAARQRLAELIAADKQASDRLALLDSIRSRAYAAFETAEAALKEAQAEAERAARRAHEHLVAAFLDDAPPAFPTRKAAAAKLAAAQEAAADAEAAWRAIGAEADVLRRGAAERQQQIRDCAESIMQEECQGAVVALVAELNEMHRRMVERHQLLAWLVHNHVTADWGPKAQPGVGELISRTLSAPQTWSVWRGEAAVVQQWTAALEALKRDPAAEIPR